MRIVFETPPVPAIDKFPDGTVIRGTAKLVARLFDAGDPEAPKYRAIGVALWRRTSLHADGSLPCPLHPFLTGPAAVFIPRVVIESLPEDGLLAIQWEVKPGALP